MNHVCIEVLIDEEKVYCLCRGSCTNKRINTCDKLCETRFMVVSCKATEEAANSAPMDSRLTHVSILQEQLRALKIENAMTKEHKR